MEWADSGLFRIEEWTNDKNETGNNVHRFQHRHKTPVQAKMTTDQLKQGALNSGQKLEKSIKDDRLRLVFHPQIELSSGKISGFEAMLRLDTGLSCNLLAENFLPLMEKTRQISKIEEWLIDSVCRQRREWHDNGVLAPDNRIAINLSAYLFSDRRLCDILSTTIRAHNISPSMIEIEVSETALMENVNHTSSTIKALRASGVVVSVDDFGTGYSSLAYLKHFDVGSLKIDQYFMQSIATNSEDQAIVAAVIKIAHRLGMTTIAEGVENKTQLLMLRNLNCDFAQGQLFSRPLLAGHVMDFIIHWRTEKCEQSGWRSQFSQV